MDRLTFRDADSSARIDSFADAVGIVNKLCDYEDAEERGELVRGRITEDGTCSVCGCYIPTDDAHDAIFRSEVHFCYYCGVDLREDTNDN